VSFDFFFVKEEGKEENKKRREQKRLGRRKAKTGYNPNPK
jgi:hypothetical protein